MERELFCTNELDSLLQRMMAEVVARVDEIPKEQFLISTDDEILANLLPSHRIEPLSLLTDYKEMEQNETQIQITDQFGASFGDAEYVPGTEIVVSIPFVGNLGLWSHRPRPSSSVRPLGDLINDHGVKKLVIRISYPHQADPVEFKNRFDRQLELIEQFIYSSGRQVAEYNSSIETNVLRAILERRTRLEKHANIAAILAIPLKSRAGAPAIQPMRLELKNTTPSSLPVPPATGLAPEPGVSDGHYNHILGIIRHEGRSFETAPSTFAMHDEEGLRNIILAHLNGHFKGGATGETFRRNGKTDIRIEERSRAAFIAECKLWNGPSDVGKAIDQLLGYLTWRDSKAALIFFNTSVAGFAELPNKLRQALLDHRFCISEKQSNEHGEYRTLMRSLEDPGRRVLVHTFIFNLYNKKT